MWVYTFVWMVVMKIIFTEEKTQLPSWKVNTKKKVLSFLSSYSFLCVTFSDTVTYKYQLCYMLLSLYCMASFPFFILLIHLLFTVKILDILLILFFFPSSSESNKLTKAHWTGSLVFFSLSLFSMCLCCKTHLFELHQ